MCVIESKNICAHRDDVKLETAKTADRGIGLAVEVKLQEQSRTCTSKIWKAVKPNRSHILQWLSEANRMKRLEGAKTHQEWGRGNQTKMVC